MKYLKYKTVRNQWKYIGSFSWELEDGVLEVFDYDNGMSSVTKFKEGGVECYIVAFGD